MGKISKTPGPVNLQYTLPTKKKAEPKFLPWQIPVINDTESRVIFLSGSAGGGKSFCFGQKMRIYAEIFPGSFILLLRKTRESITSSTALYLQDEIFDPNTTKHVKHESLFRFTNGSIIKYAGMATERERQRIRSIGLKGGVDMIVFEEASEFEEDDFEEAITRLRGRAGSFRQVILATNPDSPHSFLYKRFVLGNEAKVYYSGAKDNPHNPEDYEKSLSLVTGVRRERMVLGNWVHAEGIVFSNFDADKHVIDNFDILAQISENPDNWMITLGIDFGFEHPTCCLWIATDISDPKNKVSYVYKEIFQSKMIAQELGSMILDNSTVMEREKMKVFTDHQAAERSILRRNGD